MFTINPTSAKSINSLLKELRKTDKPLALIARKVFTNLKNKEFDVQPAVSKDLAQAYNGKEKSVSVSLACSKIFSSITFDEIDEEIIVPEICIEEVPQRFAFIAETAYEDMTAYELSLCLFKDLGTEKEVEISNLNTGLKIKLDMLDQLKEALVVKYPSIRVELLEEKLANALAVTKLEKSSSLALFEGNLAVYGHLATTKTVDSTNFKFLAEIGGDKTKTLDILILQSAFKTYKEFVALGDLPQTDNNFNLAVMAMVQGVKPVSEKNKENLNNLF